MPKKKTDLPIESEEAGSRELKKVDEMKPKRRIPRKKTEQPEAAANSRETAPEPVPEPSEAAKAAAAMDAMHRNSRRTEKADASFLTPEKYSFGLKPARRSIGQRLLKIFIYLVGIIIILAAIGLVLVTVYPNKVNLAWLHLGSGNTASNNGGASSGANLDAVPSNITPANNSAGANTTGAASSTSRTVNIAIVNAPKSIQAYFDNAFKSINSVSYIADDTNTDTLPQVKADTVFFKASAQKNIDQVTGILKNVGITAQIQQQDNLKDDVVVYLVSNPTNLDLSAYRAAAYNASGVSGGAKKVCDVLVKYKVSACSALNFPTNTTGSTVYYKNEAILVTLNRIPEFQKMAFAKADPTQVEDIKIVVGK